MNTCVKRNVNKKTVSAVIILLLASIGYAVNSKAAASSNEQPVPTLILRWVDCANKMGSTTPLSERELNHIVRTIAAESPNNSPDFLQLAVAVSVVESKLNRMAVSPSGAVGLMQLTLIGAQEAEQQCPVLRPTLGESSMALQLRLLGLRDNVKYGTCLLDFYLRQADGNVMNALVLYNGGYQQLTRLTNTGTLSNETMQYVLRVHSLLGRCQ